MLNVNQRTSALVDIEPENPYWIDAMFPTDEMFIMNHEFNQQDLLKLRYINGFMFMLRSDGVYVTADFRSKKYLVATTVARNTYVVWRRLTDINQLLPVLVDGRLYNPLTGEDFGECTDFKPISEVSAGMGIYGKYEDNKYAIKLGKLGSRISKEYKDLRLLTWTGAKWVGDEIVVGLDDIVFKSSEISPVMQRGDYLCITSPLSTIERYKSIIITKSYKANCMFKELYINEDKE